MKTTLYQFQRNVTGTIHIWWKALIIVNINIFIRTFMGLFANVTSQLYLRVLSSDTSNFPHLKGDNSQTRVRYLLLPL